MAFTIDGTAGETFPDGTTQATGVPAPGASGNVLVSNGTAWTSGVGGGMTLLGTISVTAVNSVSLSGLNLTGYKSLYIVAANFGPGSGSTSTYMSSTNVQSGGGYYSTTIGTAYWGTYWLDLTTGSIGGWGSTQTVANTSSALLGGGQTNVSTSTTTIYLRVGATGVFLAGGTVSIYGVK